MPALPTPLAADFADRLDAILTEEHAQGHTELAYLIEMAVQIARQRIEAQGRMPAIVDSQILRPKASSP